VICKQELKRTDPAIGLSRSPERCRATVIAAAKTLEAATGMAPERTSDMAKGQKRSNKEVRKPKAEKPKKNASNPSTKGMVEAAKR
jgi:hypothetical protein